MLKTENVLSALPLVADALGRKYGVKVHIGGQRAYTDGRDIHIPAIPFDADMDTLNLARGYLDHESAHLRITDFDVLKHANLEPIEKHVWNIIEDFMVERKLAAIYPGCQRNFNWLIEHLFLYENGSDNNCDEPDAAVIFNWLLVSLRALSVPDLECKTRKLAESIEEKYPDLLPELEPLVLAIPDECHDTLSCIGMAKEIVGKIREYVEKHKQENSFQDWDRKASGHSGKGRQKSQETHKGGITENKQSHGDSVNEPHNADEEAPPQEDTESNSDNNSETANPSSEGEQQQDNTGEGLKSGQEDFKSVDDANPNDVEQELATDHHKTLEEILDDPSYLKSQDIGNLAGELLETANQQGSPHQLTVAMPNHVQTDALSAQEISAIRQQTSALRTRLTGMLQATVLRRNHIGRCGRVDTRRMARLAVNDPRIFAKHNRKQGMNTAVHILLDASGSMGRDKIKLACCACYAVADALWQIPGVAVAVTSFPAGEIWDAKTAQSTWATVGTILKHKERLHNRFAVRSDGNTPMAEALWWALQQMKPLPEERKIILILSDGAPDLYEETRQAIKAQQSQGHEVYGIGINTGAMRNLLSDKYCRSIYDLGELAAAMFEMLKTTLLQGKGE